MNREDGVIKTGSETLKRWMIALIPLGAMNCLQFIGTK